MKRRRAPASPRHAALALLLLLPAVSRADEVSSALYVRTDSDDTTVISPRAHADVAVDEATRVDVVYTADVWTSASIDIRTAASKRVTEQRDELDATVSHDFEDLTLGGGYRLSYENDYESHAVSGSLSLDFADNAATLAVGGFVSKDTVGRSGHPEFARELGSFGARASLTQVLDRESLVVGGYELTRLDGYQSSPYRFVGIDGPCTGEAPGLSCDPERTPATRMRHALYLRGKRALGGDVSLGLGYRLYFDDWSIGSHTIEAELGFLPDEASLLALRYRFYTQGGAAFYKPRYASSDDLRYLTSDRELSPMGLHRVGLDADRGFALDDATRLRLSLSLGLTRYGYDDFPGLRAVTAYEVGAALGVEVD